MLLKSKMDASAASAEPKLHENTDRKDQDDTADREMHDSKPSPKSTGKKGDPKHDSKDSDDDEEEANNSSSLFRIDSGLLPFPEKLMALLDNGEVSDAMWWLPDGDAFCLIPQVFAEQVLDKHFQGTKFESFTRKLNRWGFKRVAGQKVPTNTIAYYNKNFLRGKPKLLKNMNGGKTKFISAREKRVRAQLKRERDREQAVLIAAQQQALYNNNGSASSSNRLGIGGGVASLAGSQSAGLAGANSLGAVNGIQSLLSGNRFGLSNQQENSRLAELYAAEQALAVQQHREELQMRLLRAGGGLGGLGSLNESNQLLAARNALGSGSQFAGIGDVASLNQLRRGSSEAGKSPSTSGLQGDVANEQLLLARQMGGGSGSLAAQQARLASFGQDDSVKLLRQQLEQEQLLRTQALLEKQQQARLAGLSTEDASKLMQQRMEEERMLQVKALLAREQQQAMAGLSQTDAAKLLQQRRMEEEQLLKTRALLAKQQQQGVAGTNNIDQGQVDPQLLRLYLLEQQQRKGGFQG